MDSDKPKKQKKVVQKYNLHEAEDLFGTLLSDDRADNEDDLFGLDDGLYDDTYSEIGLGDEEPYESDAEQPEEGTPLFEDTYSELALGDEPTLEEESELEELETFPEKVALPEQEPEEERIEDEAEPTPAASESTAAIIEYMGGARQEVTQARLFQPDENTALLIDEETNDGVLVSFDQVSCFRIAVLPPGISGKGRRSAIPEIIETADGIIHHELVASRQERENFLLCFAKDDQSPYPFALFPKANLKNRTQDRPLTDILLEKRFISRIMLTRAQQEFKQLKDMTLERIIAQKARTPLAEIEEALQQAQQGPLQGMQKEEILLISGFANEEEIFAALEELENIKKMNIGHFLIEKGFVKETEVYSALAEKHRIPFIDLTGRKFSKTTLASLPRNMVLNHEILPLAMKEDTLLVATHHLDKTDLSAEIVKCAGCRHVVFVLSPPSQLHKIIHMLFERRRH